ncbi:MAG: 2-oxo acid dehydrogenase subunit E2, partial [Thermoanaerobaculaceae bacterium]|nr:2-oxo acid dehydrogenase subunit E2 [Thermoanaerobaculaceae bacterium]
MSDGTRPPSDFGPNTWLIEEMYRELQEHPEGVSAGWREFFSDYRPAPGRSVPPPPATPAPAAAVAPPSPAVPADTTPILGPARRLVENMETSLGVPTATSVRTLPVKLMEENRSLLNQHLAEEAGGKVSFTHLIAWAMVKALAKHPAMRTVFLAVDGVPHRRALEVVNLGLAVDVARRDGSRALVVPAVKGAQALSFDRFFAAANDLIRRAQRGQLGPEDFQDVTVSLTNPGMLGTTHSIARLMAGQSLILAAGSIAWPAEYQQADERTLARLGVSKVMTLTCTYDHRVIQGADSAAFLRDLTGLLAGEGGFYEEVFASLEAPHAPLQMARDRNPYLGEHGVDALIDKQASVLQLVNMFRVRGHLLAHTNPLDTSVPTHPELETSRYGLTLWDLDREFATGGIAGERRMTLREIVAVLRKAYCGTIAVEYMHIQEPDQKAWIQQRVEGVAWEKLLGREDKRRILSCLNAAEAFERFLHTKYVGHKRFSL